MSDGNPANGVQTDPGTGNQTDPSAGTSSHNEEQHSTNPLYPDLKSYKDENRMLKQQLAEQNLRIQKENEAKSLAEREAAAKSAEDYQNLKAQLQAEHDAKTRNLDLINQGATQGINQAFILQADDGKMAVEEVIAKGKELQDAFTKSPGGVPPATIVGGSTPAHTGKRVWKESEISALPRHEYRKNRDEIQAALRENRVLKGQ